MLLEESEDEDGEVTTTDANPTPEADHTTPIPNSENTNPTAGAADHNTPILNSEDTNPTAKDTTPISDTGAENTLPSDNTDGVENGS